MALDGMDWIVALGKEHGQGVIQFPVLISFNFSSTATTARCVGQESVRLF